MTRQTKLIIGALVFGCFLALATGCDKKLPHTYTRIIDSSDLSAVNGEGVNYWVQTVREGDGCYKIYTPHNSEMSEDGVLVESRIKGAVPAVAAVSC